MSDPDKTPIPRAKTELDLLEDRLVRVFLETDTKVDSLLAMVAKFFEELQVERTERRSLEERVDWLERHVRDTERPSANNSNGGFGID